VDAATANLQWRVLALVTAITKKIAARRKMRLSFRAFMADARALRKNQEIILDAVRCSRCLVNIKSACESVLENRKAHKDKMTDGELCARRVVR
jgi:hypothetical protein